MDAAMRTAHHIFSRLSRLRRQIFTGGFKQQVNHCGNSEQKYQTTHVYSVATTRSGKDAV
jgi:hypothetical protein